VSEDKQTVEQTPNSPPYQDEPIAVVLCRATNLWPDEATNYEDFMRNDLLIAFDDLTKEQVDSLPEDARNWGYEAINAIVHGNPIGVCPGWGEVFDVEDRSPMFASVESDPEEKPIRGKGKHQAKANGKGKGKVARGAKAKAKAAPRPARELSTGKTSRIMDEVYENPKISVAQIIENLAKKGIDCVVPSTTVVRSFYRHSIKHLESKGALKVKIDL
jgi:hypothetical protein